MLREVNIAKSKDRLETEKLVVDADFYLDSYLQSPAPPPAAPLPVDDATLKEVSTIVTNVQKPSNPKPNQQ